MADQESGSGFALVCDEQGTILHFVRDELGIAGHVKSGQPLTAVVDRESRDKTLALLDTLRRQNAAFDWELNVPLAGSITPLHFAGGIIGDKLFIVGARSRLVMTQLYEELTKINNEQTNALRTAMKELSLRARPQTERDSELYDELSHLNNELVTLQRQMAKQNIILERLNEQKNQFLGMAAHDLRNPLSIILAYSGFLLEEAVDALTEEQIEFVSIIQGSSQFMLGLVNNLLDVSKIEAGKLKLERQLADLNSLLEHNVVLNRILAAKKQIQLIFDPPENFPDLMIDPAKIEQVLNNLMTNAVKFSYPGSTVEIRLAHRDERAIISVRDEGPGIPKNELNQLFKPFGKTSVQSTGGERNTGLGLVIARRIVEGHQGQIWVESEVGTGSTFYFSLPLESPSAFDD